MLTLLHGSMEPLFYGVIIFLGLFSLYFKLVHGKIISFIIELSIFIIVFRLHGGTMNGGFAATVAALLGGLIMPFFLPRWMK
jgi:hypothetical protein